MSRNARKFRTLAEMMPQLVWTADPSGKVDYMNMRWQELTGADGARIDFCSELHEADRDAVRSRWSECVRAGVEFDSEYRLLGKDGAWRWHVGRAFPVRDEAGRIEGWIGTSIDIQDQKLGDTEAKRAVRSRDDFMSIASHEVKTPLTALKLQLGLMESLLRQGRCDMARVLIGLRNSIKQTDRVVQLIDDLMDVSRIQNGKLIHRFGRMDLSETAREVVERFAPLAAAADTVLEAELAPELTGDWDRFRLEQVLSNLLSNALKYASGGPIRVSTSRDSDWARLQVRDFGPGIDPAKQECIFAKFERASGKSCRESLGLGLYITRHIVETHGGRIRVDSRPGAGATFTVELPLVRRAAS